MNVFKCYDFFCKKIEGWDEVRKQQVLNFFLEIMITVVEVDDELESNLLFGRLNTRGVKLSTADYIKYTMLSEIDGDIERQELLSILNDIRRNLSSLKESLLLEDFIEIIYKIEFPNNDFDLKKFKENIRHPKDIKNYISDLKQKSEKLAQYKTEAKYFVKLTKNEEKSFFNFVKLVLSDRFDTNSIKRLMKTLTNLELIRQVSLNLASMNIEEFEQLDAMELFEEQMFYNLAIKIMPKWNDFCEWLKNGRYIDGKSFGDEEMYLSYILYSLLEDSIYYDDPKLTIEHILSKSERENDSSDYLNLGNLMILEKKWNKKADNKPLHEKEKFYRESDISQVHNFLNRKKRQRTRWEVNEDKKWDVTTFNQTMIESRTFYLLSQWYDNTKNEINENIEKLRTL